MSEKFDPRQPQYKKVSDLPEEHRGGFVDVPEEAGGGFVRKEAVESDAGFEKEAMDSNKKRPLFDKLFRKGKVSAINIAHEKALDDNRAYEEERRAEEAKEEAKKRQKRQEQAINIAHEEALDDNRTYDEERKKAKEIDEYLASVDIRGKGLAGLKKIAGDLKCEYWGREDYDVVEAVVKLVLDLRRRTGHSYKEILAEAADVYIAIDRHDFTGWSHSLCHLFESYPYFASFLDAQDKAAANLVDEAIARSIQNREISNVSRIVRPILLYNLHHIDLNQLDSVFAFKPDSLSRPEFYSLFSEYDNSSKVFCATKTPREFLARCVRESVLLPNELPPEKVVGLLHAMRESVSVGELDSYINKFYRVNGQDTTFETLTVNFEKSVDASEVVEGVYVDVEGTLITNKGELNNNTVMSLEEAAASGKKVVVFSGGQPEALTERLRELGLSEKFLPVVSKEGFKGRVLEELIDDTIPEYQGFKAKEHLWPRESM